MLAALCLTLGWRDRGCAVLLAVLWFLRPLEPDVWGAWIAVPLLLLLQAAVPAAPYGSASVRGRADPAGGWSLPAGLLRLRFAVLGCFVLYVCFPRAGFAPDSLHAWSAEALGPWRVVAAVVCAWLALLVHERALGWIWLAFLAAAIATAFEPGKEGARFALWIALAANFQPGWIAPLRESGIERIYYDGGCALCHGVVRFVLAEDREAAFRFAALEGAGLPMGLPDSIVVRTADGRLLVRSEAVLHVLARLGGFWRGLSRIARVVPRPLRDGAYVLVAALRKRVFGTKTDACPMLPRHLRARFGG
ncbi:MAG: DUF393 domain-containing protein [Planctomycetes bacterium]|nr:DUF393 domain-containing protein [Planctomycetota bacterium]